MRVRERTVLYGSLCHPYRYNTQGTPSLTSLLKAVPVWYLQLFSHLGLVSKTRRLCVAIWTVLFFCCLFFFGLYLFCFWQFLLFCIFRQSPLWQQCLLQTILCILGVSGYVSHHCSRLLLCFWNGHDMSCGWRIIFVFREYVTDPTSPSVAVSTPNNTVHLRSFRTFRHPMWRVSIYQSNQ